MIHERTMSLLRDGYYRFTTPELRLWLYKMRHSGDFQRLRRGVNPSSKGDFSLREFDRFRCIFIHVTKTAGTAVAKALFGELPYHYTARQYRVIYGRRDFRRYFKFAFVRNPWDRLHSAYSFLASGGWDDDDKRWYEENLSDISDFDSFVTDWLSPQRLQSHIHFWPQVEFLCDRRNRFLVDFLGYFELIESDFRLITRSLGIPGELGHENKSGKPDYREVYTAQARQKVALLYATDIRRFGYRFSGPPAPRIEIPREIRSRT